MTPFLDLFLLVNNEEELLQYCLESYESIVDLVQIVSIVDNNSTDASLDIIESFKTRLPITLQHHRENSHHGIMRTKAISICKAPWIMYLDSDESWDTGFRQFLLDGWHEKADQIRFFKYTTIQDRNHFVPGGNGYTERMFRNLDGVHFPQSIHTMPTAGFNKTLDMAQERILLFDATACKSVEALWAKGFRYQWSAREKVPAIGPSWEYVYRVNEAYKRNAIEEFSSEIKARIFTGPEYDANRERFNHEFMPHEFDKPMPSA